VSDAAQPTFVPIRSEREGMSYGRGRVAERRTGVVFPIDQEKYGMSFAEWQRRISQSGLVKHMELVQFLKAEHGMGYGHGNALVGWTLQGNRAE